MEPAADVSGACDASGNCPPSYWTDAATKNKFVFDDVTTMRLEDGYITSPYAYKKLRMSSFNYFVDSEVFRITGKVVTRSFDIDADIIEFTVNDPPITKSLIVSTSDKYNNATMKTQFNITTVNKTITSG